ncbi:group 1 glycosyl transferase [Calothrix sp. NIES-4101]|nr:group 1 glycosyl transferase [Calothrix sp. NIES-4101]
MNILVISYYQLYPFETGASIAQFGMIEYLSNLCHISLLLPENSSMTNKEFTKLNELLPNVKIYTIHSMRQHESNSKTQRKYISSKIFRFLQIFKNKLKFFFKKNQIVNVGNLQNISVEEDFIDRYSSYNPYYLHTKKYIEKIHEIIVQDEIDIVQLEFLENLNLVTAIPASVKKVFVQHEGMFYRIKSHIIAKQIESVVTDYIFNFYKSIELSLLEQFDGILTFNDSEKEILKISLEKRNNKLSFCVSPYPILEPDFQKLDRETFLKPNKLIFVGGENHFPNKDAVEWFLEETAVEIFKNFRLRLYVIGKWSLDTIEKYKNHPSQVCFLGYVEDLYEFSKGSISIAPVRIGGGLRTKIMLAMAQGIPVICTKFALEGINAKHLESVMIAENKDLFCWSVEYLLADCERTYMMCRNAQNLIRQEYSQPIVSQVRHSFYKSLLSNSLEPDNFVSS